MGWRELYENYEKSMRTMENARYNTKNVKERTGNRGLEKNVVRDCRGIVNMEKPTQEYLQRTERWVRIVDYSRGGCNETHMQI